MQYFTTGRIRENPQPSFRRAPGGAPPNAMHAVFLLEIGILAWTLVHLKGRDKGVTLGLIANQGNPAVVDETDPREIRRP